MTWTEGLPVSVQLLTLYAAVHAEFVTGDAPALLGAIAAALGLDLNSQASTRLPE